MIAPLLLATRPKTLPAAIVPVWAGCVLAWKLTGTFDLLLAVCTLAGAVFIQIATNLFNDAIDAAKGADTERRTGPQRVTASGLVSRRAVMVAGGVFLLLAFACGVVLYQAAGWPILAIGVPSLYLAYGYTGGPFPLAYRGMGELFVVLFFGLVAVAGTVFVQTLEWRPEAFLLGGQIGLLSAVLISINNLRDREEDATTGKRTLAVRLGPKPARIVIWLEIKLAVFLGLVWFAFGLPWLVLATLPLWTLGLRILWGAFTMPEGKGMNRLLAMAALQLVAFAGMFHLLAAKL
ncbi:1,4-dihydroxy-2-naphthoate octaprenyltransferase [Luteolibacter marinus]|uniref:1,4-dihydroxy-2-naphthoate octaprenyltransferase n=1 Tax=Luteolibacter marinus TaxID=2776705 RepID=UPI0018682A24